MKTQNQVGAFLSGSGDEKLLRTAAPTAITTTIDGSSATARSNGRNDALSGRGVLASRSATSAGVGSSASVSIICARARRSLRTIHHTSRAQ